MNQLSYIAPHRTAVVCGLVVAVATAIFFIPLAALMYLATLADGTGESVMITFSLSLVAFVFAPLVYFIMTYIGVLILAWVYNLIARKTGGIKFKLTPVDPSNPPQQQLEAEQG
ncbi:hypothetical protein IDAT_11230 [Pseudidiomarina atlantica]|uniref:DUF3566 domain-containing protein n=1 Tax=Pseudidiomarina atlantica TaxID=1517416 RepID=A0A094IKB2_9GAMM|nr:hypothetical protein [Pseudidiomarina atlantica]KFZ28150.1 hypothetical protein IDAT_11230 [Pseudidiomarina atlantica]